MFLRENVPRTTMTLKYTFCYIFFFITILSYSQLSDFNLDVVATDETCLGNGSLEMTVSNTTDGSEIIYTLFLSPDFTNAIAETSANSFGSLQSGSYRIIATQTLGEQSNTQQEDVIIDDLVVDLDYGISHSTVTECDVTGTISINILSGNAVSYEIISGPVTVAPQVSNEFSGLPSGTYVIRVSDECEDALSKTYTMSLTTNVLGISAGTLPVVFDSCESAAITNIITPSPGTEIVYPLTVTYTIHPPDGSPDITTTETFETGLPDSLELVKMFTLYGNEIFIYDLLITDDCGNEFSLENTINPNPVVGIIVNDAICGKYMTLSVNTFFPPITINFTDSPDDFNPTALNPDYPGPFNEMAIDFGDDETPVPFGTYEVTIVDACGRTGTILTLIEEADLEPIIGEGNNGCGSDLGILRIEIPEDRLIVAATITVAPEDYEPTLPDDVFEFVDTLGRLVMVDIPVGDYVLTVIDECGVEYIIEVNVPEFILQGLSGFARPNCDPGSGSLRLSSGNDALVSVIMTGAPLTYMQTLPYDISFNIDESGFLFMNDLPAGTYTFEAVDACGFSLETTVDVVGYVSTQDGYLLTRNCGSFDLGIFDADTTVTDQTYWFQKFFPETNTWGHPITGAPYTEGTIPDGVNSIQMLNYNTVFNIFLTGDFRIIKIFESFNNGSANNNNCTDLYAEFNVSSNLIISGAYSLDCNGGSGPSDIILDVVGVSPYNFSITEPFVFDNGESNTFTGLAAGIYSFRVQDICGSIENILVEVGNLLPLARANEPNSMLVCRDDGIELAVFILSDQDAQILGNQNANNYSVTYHISQADANSGDNPLPEAYTNITNPQTIYARVVHKELGDCYATTSFSVFIGSSPVLSPSDPVFICEGFSRTLIADAGYGAYEWSTGETTQSISVNTPGVYSVIVKNVYDDFTCDTAKEYTVTGSGIASFQNIDISDWSPGNNSITVLVSGTGDYEYSLDDEVYQDENVFTNLLPGNYTVYVRDKNGCGKIMDEFSLLNFPNFFTPNGDGYNDVWHIKFASFEPELKINIFDRYGKFIIQLFGDGPGWDGTYNGRVLPSTDYWFVVKRVDGTTHKGHFALKR